jgi:hypothetical protein
MTEKTPVLRASGPLIRVCQSLPAVEIDCSDWPREAETRSSGQLVRVCDSLPAVEMEFVCETDLFLELTFTLVPGADANRVFSKVTALCEQANNYERSLGGAGLRWNKERSTAHNGTLQLVLVPNNSETAQQHLQMLATLLVSAVAENASVRTIQARGCRVAQPNQPLFELKEAAA